MGSGEGTSSFLPLDCVYVARMRENSFEVSCFPCDLWSCGTVVHEASTAASWGAQEFVCSLSQFCQMISLRMNTLYSLSYSLLAFHLASLSLGLSLWFLKSLFWKPRKMNIFSFFFHPVSIQFLLKIIWTNCIWLGNKKPGKEKRTRINCFRKNEICYFFQVIDFSTLFGGESVPSSAFHSPFALLFLIFSPLTLSRPTTC